MSEQQVSTNVNIEYVDAHLIQFNDYNPKEKIEENEENKKIFDRLVNSIREFGYTEPVEVREVDGDVPYEVVDGQHRLLALRELGIKNIPVNNLGKMSLDEAMVRTVNKDVVKIPYNDLMLAQTLNRIQNEEYRAKLPYSKDELDEKLSMLSFNWDEYVESKLDLDVKNKDEQDKAEFKVDEDTFERYSKELEQATKPTDSEGKVIKMQKTESIKLSRDTYERFRAVMDRKRQDGLSDDEIFKQIIEQVG